jgi:epoxyqueuosine reductase
MRLSRRERANKHLPGRETVIERIGMFVGQPKLIRRLAWVPSTPAYFRRHYLAHRGAWRTDPIEVPEELKTIPGAWRDRDAEDETYRRDPLHDFIGGNPAAVQFMIPRMWRSIVPTAPRLSRARLKMVEISRKSLTSPTNRLRQTIDPDALTRRAKEQAVAAGLSAIGIASYDERYEFVEYHEQRVGDRVIVCVLEQNYPSTQTLPSARAEQAAMSAYAETIEMAVAVATDLQQQGFRAVVHGPEGQNIAIHYAVEAGLGQLGLNGQLLTPTAGSRCRLITINTDAPLVLDHPVDYGIHKICDECKACVRRCPVNAIPGKRDWYRGVLKSKVNTQRCVPIVAQAHGCSICMKVCPIQKYGLSAVISEYERSGQIMGRGSDELEGYDWPLDGEHYGPGQHPEIPVEIREPPGLVIEMNPKQGSLAIRVWS